MTPHGEAVGLIMSPVGDQARTAGLIALRTAALEGDFAAAKALSAVVACELGFEHVVDPLLEPGTAEELAADPRIPVIIRSFALGYRPRDFLTFRSPGNSVHEAFIRLQHAARCGSILQHDLLRAFILDELSRATANDGVVPWRAMALHVAVHEAAVVPGFNMDTHLQIGRELILRADTQGEMLAGVLHEFGHLELDSHPFRQRAGAADLAELDSALPTLLAAAFERGTERFEEEDPRIKRLPAGTRILCTVQPLPEGDRLLTHLSLSISGAPIDAVTAARYALLFTRHAGLSADAVAVAYSVSGIFHVAALIDGRPSESGGEPRPSQDEGVLWLGELRDSGRFHASEQDLLAAVIGQPESVKIFASSKADYADWLRGSLLAIGAVLAEEPPEALIRAATRSASAAALRTVRSFFAGSRTDMTMLGSCVGLKVHGGEIEYFGATEQSLRELIREPGDLGLAWDEPVDQDGSTLLINAATRSPAFVSLLLEAGADPNAATTEGQTALYRAAQYGRHAEAELLLAAGAQPNRAAADGRTPLVIATRPELVTLLCDHGADVDATDHAGWCALTCAVQAQRVDVVAALLERQADPDLPTRSGVCAIHLAVGIRDALVRERLVAALLAAQAAVDEVTNSGTTALMIAVKRGHVGTMITLLAHGATANVVAGDGRSALSLAVDGHQGEATQRTLVRLLLEAGADPEAAGVNVIPWTSRG